MTIKEFASIVGVSPATVSRAVRGYSNVKPATRDLILAKAEKLGYQPNLNAQRLISGRTQVIAFASISQEILSDPFLLDVSRYVQHHLHENGYDLMLNLATETKQGDVLERWIGSGMVDGAIICGPTWEKLTRIAKSKDTPIVSIGSYSSIYDGVTIDLTSGTRQAVKRIIELGHKNIGIITFEKSWTDSVDNIIVETAKEFGVSITNQNVIYIEDKAEFGGMAFANLMALDSPPTVILCRSDIMALGAMLEARQRNISVPDDVSIVGFDDSYFASITVPQMSTIRVDTEAIANSAVKIILEALANPDVSPVSINVETYFVERGSTAPPKK